MNSSAEDTLEEIQALPDISMYTEPTKETLVDSLSSLIKNAPENFVKKRNDVIDEIIGSYVTALKKQTPGAEKDEEPAKPAKKEKAAKK